VRKFSIAVIVVAASLACGKDNPTQSGPPVASIILSSPAGNVMVGQTLSFSALVRDVNGDIGPDPDIQWASSSNAIATVASTGVVTGKAPGTTRISGRIGTVKDSLEITVTSNTFDVNTSGEIFLPFSLVVPLGATVRFNMVDEHNALFAPVPGAPPDIQIVTNVVVSRTFNTRGTFPYDCTIHPGMSGQIVVQ
jgi:plastocyanin